MRFRSWRTPRWLTFLLGFASVAVGASLALKPFSSLDALALFVAAALVIAGVAEFLGSGDESHPTFTRLAGAALVVAGLVAGIWPGVTVNTIAWVTGIGLVIGGLAKIVAGLRRNADERYVSLVGGLASLVIGALALSWPDATILLIALLIGPAAVIWGIIQIIHAISGANDDDAAVAKKRSPLRGWLRVARVTVSLLVALALIGVSSFLHNGSPEVAAFYDTPSSLPSSPGQLIRQESFTTGVPENARAWRILYTTTGGDGSIVPASGLVVVPKSEAAQPWPVIAWTHGTTGVERKCAPSNLDEPFESGALFVTQQIIEQGWALVAADYPGLGAKGDHPYLVGAPAARAELDAVRAARQLAEAHLGTQTVAWGHSQGGGAALWVGQEAASYAPDVLISGVAALAPASDIVALAREMQTSPAGMLFASFIVKGYSSYYDDVEFNDYIRDSAQKVVGEVTSRCLSEPATLMSLPAVLSGESIFSQDLTTGPLGERARENVPSTPTGLPTFIGQGAADQLVLPEVQSAFVDQLCAAGQIVDYHTYADRDHVAVVESDSSLMSDLFAWTQARFAGEPAATQCSRTDS
jgi:uncharacterized membrane protein HdeD (DUF308 family)/alpha-beta hydrolase superfamily lysophospholipase